MKGFEGACCAVKPDLVVVGGDVNSTIGCSLTAAKLQIPVAHIEAGLRSFDRRMPEEINRIVTDSISDLLFTTEDSGNRNLRHEGISEKKIHFVGNTMIDSLVYCQKILAKTPSAGLRSIAASGRYFLATIHRLSNVDEPQQLSRVLEIMESAAELAPVLFVTHPRTRERLQRLNSGKRFEEWNGCGRRLALGSINCLPPLPYIN
jgi:UDP-N-acetylglucosamine 2-epimerase (non-hydrolysing)